MTELLQLQDLFTQLSASYYPNIKKSPVLLAFFTVSIIVF
jgi:hypothetical protein